MGTDNVGTVVYDAVLNTAGLKKGGDEADAIAKDTGSNLEKNISKGAIAAGAAMATTGAVFMKVTKDSLASTVEWAGGINKLSRETGASTESISKLLYAGQRYGLQVDDISKSLGIFSKHISETLSGQSSYAVQQEKVRNEIAKTTKDLADNNAAITKYGDKTGVLHQKSTDLTIKLKDLNTQLAAGGDAFQKLGISLADSTGKTRPFDQIFGDVAEKFKTAPNGINKTATAMQLFGKSGKDMIPLLNLGREGIQKLGDEAQKFGLVLTKDNIPAFKKFKDASFQSEQSAKGLQVQLGLLTLGPMTRLKTATTELTQRVNNLNGPMKELIGNIIVFGGPVLTATGSLMAMAGTVGTLATAFPTLGAALTASLGPIGLIILGIAAAVAVGILVWKNWSTIMEALHPILEPLKNMLLELWNNFKLLYVQLATQLAPAIKWVSDNFDWLSKVLMVFIGAALIPVLAPIAALVAALYVLTAVVGFVATHFELAKQIIVAVMFGLVGVIINNFGTIIDFIKSVGGKILGAVSDFGHLLYNAGADLVQGLINGIKGKIGSAVGAVKDAADAIKNTFKSVLGIHSPSTVFAGFGKNIVQGLAMGINNNLGAVSGAVNGMTSAASLTAQARGANSVDGIATTGTGQTNNGITINMSGIMTRSKADEREIARSLVERLNESLRAKGVPEIGNGALSA